MPDPIDPSQPPPSPVTTPPSTGPEPDASGKSTSTGLPSNVAAALACIPLVGGIIFYILEKQDNFVRFYAMQSIILGGAWFLFWIIYSIAFAILVPIPVIGLIFRIVLWSIWFVAGITFLVLWLVATFKA